MEFNNSIKASIIEHTATKTRFRVTPNLHARAHARTSARAIAEFLYEAALTDTQFYRTLYGVLAEGKSLSYDGCEFPVEVVVVLKHYLVNVDSVIREMAIEKAERRELLAVFAETLDYNTHRLMQV